MLRHRRSVPRDPGRPLLLALMLLTAAAGLAQDANHLLLSEVVVQTRPPVSSFGSPFIEVVNPTAGAVDLTQVHLTTAHNTQLGRLYWNVTTGVDAGGGTSGNVHGRFPAGMSLAAGDTLVISIAGSDEFAEAYGYLPDLEWFEDGAVPDQVPEMVEVFTGSIGAGLGSEEVNTPALSTSFDSIVLYRWDGVSDLVEDLDYLIYGNDTRVRVDKTGVTVGSGTYLPDTAVGAQTSAGSAPTFTHSLQRVNAVETGEPQSGGNGVDGHDETGEDLVTSWQDLASQDPAAPPASYFPAAPIVLSATSGGAVEDAPVTLQAEVVAFDGVGDVTFRYRLDGGSWQDLTGTAAGDDRFTAQVPGQAAGTVVDWFLVTTGTGGGEATWPVEGAAQPRSFTVSSGGTPGGPIKLLLTEVSVIGTPEEYIEITNPGSFDADLTDFYLTDAIFADGSQYYWRIAEGNPSADTIGGGAYSDFHARFPAGFVLAAGDTITISVAGSDAFYGVFGFLPHLELFEDGPEPDGVPDMRPVFGDPDGDNSIVGAGSTPGLSNGSESLTLYYWDGLTDLVTDIDVFFWGADDRWRYCKTGVTVGGSTYQNETAVADQDPYLPAVAGGNSFHRIDPSEGAQPGSPGNGIDGRDEVGEDFSNTFTTAPYDPARPAVEGPQILGVYTSPAYEGRDITIRATIASGDPLASVTVAYTLDGGSEIELAAADNGDDTWDAVIPAQDEGTVVTWHLTVVDIEGDDAIYPSDGGVITFTVSAAPDPEDLAAHLLITEVRPRGAEFIEIHNPLDRDIPLDRYYLTDAIFASGSQYYWRITEGSPSQSTIGGGAYDDFHGQFPPGAVIAAGQTITVALAGSDNFYAEYFIEPDYELFEDGDEPDDIPELVEVFEGSLAAIQEPYGNPPGLSNNGEIVILYWWDGESDLVTDVDVFHWDVTGLYESTRFSKNGVTSGGSVYGPELAVADQMPHYEATSGTQSYSRQNTEEDAENQGGLGNGVDGHDETSENFPASFVVTDATPGQFYEVVEGEQGVVALEVEAKTFLPDLETFPIRFTTRTDSETKIRIIDLEGRLVKSVYDSRFDGVASTVPGVWTERPWDGRDNTFERVRAGMYVVHLQVVDRATGEKIVKTAPVVVATRLQ